MKQHKRRLTGQYHTLDSYIHSYYRRQRIKQMTLALCYIGIAIGATLFLSWVLG